MALRSWRNGTERKKNGEKTQMLCPFEASGEERRMGMSISRMPLLIEYFFRSAQLGSFMPSVLLLLLLRSLFSRSDFMRRRRQKPP